MAARNPWETHLMPWVPVVAGHAPKPVLFLAPPAPVRVTTFQPTLTFEEAAARVFIHYSPGAALAMLVFRLAAESPDVPDWARDVARVGFLASAMIGGIQTADGIMRDLENRTLGTKVVKFLSDRSAAFQQ